MPEPLAAPEPSAVFERDGDAYLPTALANGPWSEGTLHGGPTAALLAHVCQQAPGITDVPLPLARLTVDLLRPVPVAPLRAEVRLARPGRKVDWVDATLWAGDVEVARASALRLRVRPVDLPEGTDPHSRGASGDPGFDHSPDDSSLPRRGAPSVVTGFHDRAMDIRFSRSNLDRTGPGQAWMRLRVPMIAGLPTTGFMLAAGVADFANAVGKLVPMDGYSFINPDLVVSLWREPADGWIGLDAVCRIDPAAGYGLAEGVLRDEAGPFGRCQQTILVERLP